MPNCILHIDRVTLRLGLLSLYHALRHRREGAVKVDLLLLEGVKFCAQRNEQTALNLWEALDLPDADVNVSAIMTHARTHGGMSGLDSSRSIKPLPVSATKATRKAASYRNKRTDALETRHWSCWPWHCIPRGVTSRGNDLGNGIQTKQARTYFEYPIGDPRRRPRWGVPIRFDIRQIIALRVDLWILDLLTMDRHWRFVDAGNTKMAVNSLCVSREILEAGDLRRSGSGELGDGVHGVYLGELVWSLIGQLLPKVMQKSPSSLLKTAAFAVAYGSRDSASIAAAKVIDCAVDAKRHFCREVKEKGTAPWMRSVVDCKQVRLSERIQSEGHCAVEVRLIMGRGITHEGQRVSVHAQVELRDPPEDRSTSQRQMGKVVAEDESARRTWTKSPWWDETFILGPARFDDTVLRIVVFWHSDPLLGTGFPLGEVTVLLSDLLVEDSAIDDAIVGWFPLERLQAKSSGRIKLQIRVIGRRHLVSSLC